MELTNIRVGRGVVGVAVTVAAAATLVAGVGMADAAPQKLPDRNRVLTLENGITVSNALTNQAINRVSPLSAIATSHEAFIDVRAAAQLVTIDGIKAGQQVLSLQVACQASIPDGVQVGGSLGITPSIGAQLQVSGTGVSAGPQASISATPSINVQGTVKMGEIVDIPIGKRDLSTGKSVLRVEGLHVKLDACIGSSSLRLTSSIGIHTDVSDETLYTYGKAVQF